MVLTGKAKEDFLIFLKENRRCNEKSFSEFPAIFEDALIIEWLDSVGIYIDCGYYAKGKLCSGIENETIGFISIGSNFNKRQEATTEAIKKANEIYNNLNN